MARPIPTNPAGLQHRYHVVAQPFVARQVAARPAPLPRPALAPPAAAVEEGQALLLRPLLLLVSTLTGALGVLAALELWPPLAASSLGLDERGAFYLLVASAYLLATGFSAAWRTRLLRELAQAPWDARLMAYLNLGVGGAVTLALGLVALVAVVLVGVVVAVLALALSSSDER